MPPKPPPPKHEPAPSTFRSLVPVGPRHVSTRGNRSIRNEKGQKPSTTRALILRNGKYGARGTGEVMLVSKLNGREKLDLLAEDLLKKSQTAVMSPFRLEKCLNIAESQCNVFLDEIANLRDSQNFSFLILTELNARIKVGDARNSFIRNPSYIASIVATKIHNTYLLASAWKLVAETLAKLAIDGLTDGTAKSQLKNSSDMRARYLVLYELATSLVDISQRKVSVLATTTPHYARYFKPDPDSRDPTEPDMVFDWAELRDACTSFLDSIIIELCFPHAPYPDAVLFQILHDAVDESPKESKRFPQELWNAIGDLSVSIEFRQLLEAVLAGPDAKLWKDAPHDMPQEYETWDRAQKLSEEASREYSSYQDMIFPLSKTRSPEVLNNMWEQINITYQTLTGEDIDNLWRLTDALDPTPQWHGSHTPNLADSNADSRTKSLPSGSQWRKTNAKRPAITNEPASDDSMPGLQTVSDSSYDGDENQRDSDVDYETDSETDESGYDTEQEEELREMLREAMDTAHEADWLHSKEPEGSNDTTEQHARKGNPFLKLLSSLRGRMFSSSPKLKTTTRARSPDSTIPTLQNHSIRIDAEDADVLTSLPSEQIGPYEATVEDAEDESDVPLPHTKKKKKKYKKHKKPKVLKSWYEAKDTSDGNVKPSVASPPPSPLLNKTVSKSSLNTTSTYLGGSTTTLPLPTQQKAQSSRSYIHEQSLDIEKSKVKSRPNHATVFTGKSPPGKFLQKLLCLAKGNKAEVTPGNSDQQCFPRLSKKSRACMHQLLNTAEDEMKGTASMKWESFLKLMREMGFEYNPSTAGSSVRFDPPDKRDGPITFHKPHPDPTLTPIMLKIFAKRLERHYGWSKEKFLSQPEV